MTEVNKAESKSILRKLRRSRNNWVAVVILLVGALVGSMLVDVVQIVRKSGFSDKAIISTDIVRHDGRTWVAYRDEVVPVVMIVDSEENCQLVKQSDTNCQSDELVTWLRYVVPTIAVEKVVASSELGVQMIEKYRIKQIPAVLFDEAVVSTPFFAQAAPFFQERGERYYLQTAQMGVAIGKWVVAPMREDSVIVSGKPEAEKVVTVWSNFDCVGCAKIHREAIRAVSKDENLVYIWKYRPQTPNDERGAVAASAAYCAYEQDKFAQFSDKLFTRAKQWRRQKGDKIFVSYARQLRGMNIAQFDSCLSERKFKDNIVRNLAEADDFDITMVPTVMVSTPKNIKMSTPPTTVVQLMEMIKSLNY